MNPVLQDILSTLTLTYIYNRNTLNLPLFSWPLVFFPSSYWVDQKIQNDFKQIKPVIAQLKIPNMLLFLLSVEPKLPPGLCKLPTVM